MKKLLIIAPGLADFGQSILLTILILYLFNMEPAVWHFVLGLLFSVLPDLDGVKEFFRHGKIDAGEHGDHRDGLHYPLAWAVVGSAIIFINPFIGTLFTVCVLAHFFNDSWGTGWGVQWLWPFTKRSYKLFSQNNTADDVALRQFVTSWDAEGKRYAAKNFGKSNWLEDIYGHITTISAIEYSIFLIAILVLAVYLL